MKLSSFVKAAAFKHLVTVDLPGSGSNQHELNGVSGLKKFFDSNEKIQDDLLWTYFSDDSPPIEEEGEFTFYDARAKSAAMTGRSEWRFYYTGEFLRNAGVGDLFILVKSQQNRFYALVFRKDSKVLSHAKKMFGLDSNSVKFDNVTFDSLSKVHEQGSQNNSFSIWLSQFTPEHESIPKTSEPTRKEMLPFKPRSRMLVLLGDQLIRDPGIAIFELVKNAYDADSTYANVTLRDVKNLEKGTVIVEDDGSGMNWKQIVDVWLEPGTDHRQQQKLQGYRSPRFGRLPLGEKGIGRFAAHKLGKKIKLVTRQKDSPEIVVKIDWAAFEDERYLEDALVEITERRPMHFLENATGTKIEVTELNEELTRGTIRQIQRSVNSISSPFRELDSFVANLDIIPDDNTTAGLLKIGNTIETAPYRASCMINDHTLTYDYEFVPPSNSEKIAGRKITGQKMELERVDLFSQDELQNDVGSIYIELRIFDLDNQFLSLASISDKRGYKEFLRHNGGVRVYRDGVRVYDYGEPGNDWLNLDGRRINDPSAKVGNSQIIGAVHLDGETSGKLIEKTNREGFIEDRTYELFENAVKFTVTQIVHERNKDKKRLREIFSTKKNKQPVIAELAELRTAIRKEPTLAAELTPIVDRVERKYIEMRDTLMTAAGAGLTLSVVIHEVEKGISGLVRAVEKDTSIDDLRDLAVHLSELIEGLTYLTRKSGRKKESLSSIITQSLNNTSYRTKAHQIKVLNGIELGNEDFEVTCTKRLIISTIMNLFDNSIYWLSNKQSENRKIYIGTTNNIKGGPVLFVADNGPGFQDDNETLTQPFMSRKPDGMGLGLHVAKTVMETQGGKLIFPTKDEIGIGDSYSGAIVGLQFTEI
ncbi:MAG: ATP-binding protein [Verrucomicrobiales bacterium]|nr:ATP-binding protein [Verrucomicrobiales bacterium]